MRNWTPDALQTIVEGRLASTPTTYQALADQLGATKNQVQWWWRQNRKHYEVSEPVAPVTVDPGVIDKGRYQLRGDFFVFEIEDEVYSVERLTMDRMCADYSSMGGNLTKAEIARAYALPVPVITKIFSLYEQRKDSLPFTRETMLEEGEDVMDQMEAVLERSIHRKIQEKQITQMRNRLTQLEEEEFHRVRFEEAVREQLRTLKVERPSVHEAPTEVEAYHVPTTDEHIGKYVYAKESFGEEFTTDLACERMRRHADLVRAEILKGPRAKAIYRTFVGDFWHALMGETQHGTKLDQDTRAARVWAMGLEAALYAVNTLRGLADVVHVYGAPGNHDGFHFWQMIHALQLGFNDSEDVVVHAEPTHFAAFRVGGTLHVLDHGYGYSNPETWKTKASAEVVAREVGGEDFFQAKYIYTYIGDKHSEARGTLGRHHKIWRLPSLAESDDYETGLRYASDPEAHLLELNEVGRVVGNTIFHADLLR